MNYKTITETFISGSKEKIFGILRDINPEQIIYARFENGVILKTKYMISNNQSLFIHNNKNNFDQDFMDEWLHDPRKFCNTILLTLDNKSALTVDGNYFRKCNNSNEITKEQKLNCGTEKIEFTDGEMTWTGIGCSYCQEIHHGNFNMSHELYTEPEQKAWNITETKFFCPLWVKNYLGNELK